MSLYPPPSANVPVFNPALFTNINGGVSYGSVGVGNALAFPVAQGAEIWTNGTDTATLDSGTVELTTITGVTLQGITLGANGFAYNDGVTTTTGLWTKVQAVGALSSASNATTLNVNNAIQIQNGETTAPPTSFIALEAGSNQLQMNLCQNGVTPQYGTAGQVLTSGGSAGSMTWGSGGGGSVGTLNDVLTNGNTTTNSATFTYIGGGSNFTTLAQGVGFSHTEYAVADPLDIATAELNVRLLLTGSPGAVTEKSVEVTNDNIFMTNLENNSEINIKNQNATNIIEIINTTTGKYIRLDNSIGSPAIEIFDTINGSVTSSSNGMFYYSTLPGPVGISVNTTIGGLQLTTNGVLYFQGLTGSIGQVLTRNVNGYSVWENPSVQSGKVLNPTYSATVAGTVTFGTPFTGATSPSVVLTVDTGTGSTSIVLAGVAGFTGATTNWTGFNYFISSAVPVGGYLNWVASP